VAIVDSGVEHGHPLVGEVQRSVTIGDPERDEVLGTRRATSAGT